jgi:hypothetical protein
MLSGPGETSSADIEPIVDSRLRLTPHRCHWLTSRRSSRLLTKSLQLGRCFELDETDSPANWNELSWPNLSCLSVELPVLR